MHLVSTTARSHSQPRRSFDLLYLYGLKLVSPFLFHILLTLIYFMAIASVWNQYLTETTKLATIPSKQYQNMLINHWAFLL